MMNSIADRMHRAILLYKICRKKWIWRHSNIMEQSVFQQSVLHALPQLHEQLPRAK